MDVESRSMNQIEHPSHILTTGELINSVSILGKSSIFKPGMHKKNQKMKKIYLGENWSVPHPPSEMMMS